MADPALPPGFVLDEPTPRMASRRSAPSSDALTPSRAKAIWDKTTTQFEQSIAGNPVDRQRRQRAAFYNDPRIKNLETLIATPQSAPDFQVRTPRVTTKQQEIQDIARRNVAASSPRSTALATAATAALGPLTAGLFAADPGLSNAATSSAIDTASFGLGDRLRAGLGSLANGHSYEDNLALAREETRQRNSQSGTGNILGTILGSIPSALAGGALVKSAGLAAKSPLLAKVLVGSGKPETIARIVAGGALGGGAQAAGHDESVAGGALEGAIAAPVMVGGAKSIGFLGKKAIDLLGSRNINQILKSITTATKPEIQARVDELRGQGIEPTLFEVLPLADRNAISTKIVGRSDPTLEGTQRLVTERLGNIGPEMAGRVADVAAPQRAAATQEMTDALTAARGTPAAPVPEMPGDAALAARATRDPLAMASQPGREARAIMAPHDERTLYSNINELLPSHPELQPDGQVHVVPDDPAVTAMIRTKARLLSHKNAGEASGGLTGQNVSDLLGELRSEAGNVNNPARDVARSAVQHIEEQLSLNHPEFLAAHERMNAAYAARSRMAEGASEGMNTRTRAEINPTGVTQPIINAYSSPEGATGRALGQANALETGFAQAGPRSAITQVAALPNDAAAISQNLGPEAAGQIADTAAAQTEGARALAGLDRQTKTNPATLGPDELAGAVLGLDANSMVRTKIMGAQALMRYFSGIPEAKAQQLVELLFSTNPTQRNAALGMLRQSAPGQAFLADMAEGLGLGSVTQQLTTPSSAPASPAPDNTEDSYAGLATPTDEPPPPEGFTLDSGETPTDGPSPYAEGLQQIYETESPEFLDLIDKQFHQESGNQHFGKDGKPKTSSAGAIGIAQVMPGTAPIAARLAGLPYDPHAYRNDPAYNKTLGIAYMKDQIDRFNGNAAMALAAYNWGPDRVERAVAKWGSDWLSHAPAETRNYVRNILS